MRTPPTLSRPIELRPERIAASLFSLFALLLTLLFMPSAVAADEYLLAPGDVLRVMVVGAPDISLDVPIEMDGSAWFPLVGPIAASGETLREVRRRTAEAYATMSLSAPVVALGGGLPKFIETRQVHITVASYRPIYVAGGIGGLQEFPFRTGLTLRHVLTLASGTPPRDAARPVSASEIEAAALALASQYAQIWRLRAFLGSDTPEDYDRIFVANVPAIEVIVAIEQSILDETREAIETQRQHLQGQIARIEKRIAVLSRQKENESDGLAMDEANLDNVRSLHERGLVPASRLSDARRDTLVTASRTLQIEVALENTRAQSADLKADMLAVDSDARIRAWTDLGQAAARVPERQADLADLAASAGGGAQGEFFGVMPTATVTRDGVTLDPSETLPSLALMPGDIVEFRVLPIRRDVEPDQQEADK